MSRKKIEPEDMLTVEQAAAESRRSASAIRKLVKSGALHEIFLPDGGVRLWREEVEELPPVVRGRPRKEK